MQQKSELPVGVFDSGLGGLTVAREIMRQLPNERIVYFGDTARVPYGNKSRETVIRYARQIVRFLKTQEIKTIVVACNTATAMAFDEIAKEADMPVLGVVEPGARMAVSSTKNKKIGVIATKATIASGAYSDSIRRMDPSCRVLERACPLLVPLVEEGWICDAVTDEVIGRYLRELLLEKIDTLILGCTHYPLLIGDIGKITGDAVRLVNPAYETAAALRELLEEGGLSNANAPDARESSPYRFFVSDEAERFADFANSILPIDVKAAKMVPIWEY